MTNGRGLLIVSSVDGGPVTRLAAALSQLGLDTAVSSHFTADGWRNLMSLGRARRLQARAETFGLYPFRVVAQLVRRRPRFCIITTNPFVMPLISLLTRPIHGSRVVTLLYDLYPDALEAGTNREVNGVIAHAMRRANRYVFQKADGVVFIGPEMAAYCIRLYGEPRHWTVLETGAPIDEFDDRVLGSATPENELEEWCTQGPLLSYLGNMGHVHDWETLRQAVPALLARSSTARVLVAASGPGVELLKRAWHDLPTERVRFCPPLPDRPWARVQRQTSVALVTLKDAARQSAVPSKTFSAMAAGAAIGAIAPLDSDLASYIKKHECGFVVPPGDVGALVESLAVLLDEPARLETARHNARIAVEQFYDTSRLARRWRDFLDETTGQGSVCEPDLREDGERRAFC